MRLSGTSDRAADRRLRFSAARRPLACALGVALLGLLFAAPALAAAPAVSTGTSGSVTFNSAVLFGTVDPRGSATLVFFQYGTTISYGAQTAPAQLPAGSANVSISIAASGLAANTVYHYRIVASNASGPALGADRTVKTASIPLSLAITAAPNPVPFGAPVTVEGTLTGTGSASAVVHLQANPFPYTAGFADIGNPELTLATGSFAFNVLGAAQNTEYRVISGKLVSTDVVASVAVNVTLQTRTAGTHGRPAIRFSGVIAPAEPSARIAFERLVGTKWVVLGGTIAHPNSVNGVVSFAGTVRVHSGGFFRALVLPVEGGHVSGYSGISQVRIH
jgi:hypothetical protein